MFNKKFSTNLHSVLISIRKLCSWIEDLCSIKLNQNCTTDKAIHITNKALSISNKYEEALHANFDILLNEILQKNTEELQKSHQNPLNRFGKKCFSQTDEDGITLEIIRRLGVEYGSFAEFGVGNGLENNTLILAALGWSGFWVGAEDILFDWAKCKKFTYIKEWITILNIKELTNIGLNKIGLSTVDVVSLDLDGNDIYIVEELLKCNINSKLFIVEYNAKFPPPVKFKIDYDPNHNWKYDDYFGASLASFTELFQSYGYILVCCNSHSGANAFFVKDIYIELFNDVPTDINKIYVNPRYRLYTSYGHKSSLAVIQNIFNKN